MYHKSQQNWCNLGCVFNSSFSQTRNWGALLKPQELITTCGRYLLKYGHKSTSLPSSPHKRKPPESCTNFLPNHASSERKRDKTCQTGQTCKKPKKKRRKKGENKKKTATFCHSMCPSSFDIVPLKNDFWNTILSFFTGVNSLWSTSRAPPIHWSASHPARSYMLLHYNLGVSFTTGSIGTIVYFPTWKP